MAGIETKFQRSMTKALDKTNAEHFNIHGHAFQRSGWPDHFIAHELFTGFVELKIPSGKESAIQRKRRFSLCEKGVVSVLVVFTPFETGSVRRGELQIVGLDGECSLDPPLRWDAQRNDMGVQLLQWLNEAEVALREDGDVKTSARNGLIRWLKLSKDQLTKLVR